MDGSTQPPTRKESLVKLTCEITCEWHESPTLLGAILPPTPMIIASMLFGAPELVTESQVEEIIVFMYTY